MLRRRMDSCRAPATRFRITPRIATCGSKRTQPEITAAMVRVVLVQSRHITTGAPSSLASSAVLVVPSRSMPSYRPRLPSIRAQSTRGLWEQNERRMVSALSRNVSRL